MLEPIYEQLGKDVLEQPVIHTDDTPVTVAKNEQGQTVAGRVWVYADHSDRIWYDFTPSRKRDGPARVLGNFRGYQPVEEAASGVSLECSRDPSS